MKVQGVSQKSIREKCERTGADYYIALAVWNRKGTQIASLHGPCGKPFARQVVPLILVDPKDRMQKRSKR